jgi:hypothetical protein
MAEAERSVHDALKRATSLMDCPGAIMILVRYRAIKAVKRDIQARGLKPSSVEHRVNRLGRSHVA